MNRRSSAVRALIAMLLSTMLAAVACVPSAQAEVHNSPEEFFNGTLYNYAPAYGWAGHWHTIGKVGARALPGGSIDADVCVNAYGRDGYLVGDYVCTSTNRWPVSTLAEHWFCACAMRKGYVAMKAPYRTDYIHTRANEHF